MMNLIQDYFDKGVRFMKKILLVLTSIGVFMILVWGGIAFGQSNNIGALVQNVLPIGKTGDALSSGSISQVYEKITTTTTDHLNTAASSIDGRYHRLASSQYVTLSGIKSNYAVELTGKVNENTMYVVFRMNDESIGDYYTYIFFQHVKPENQLEAEEDYWQIGGQVIRVSKRLSESDFSSITVGSTMNDVIAINPATKIMVPDEEQLANLKDSNFLSFDTFHYTDDGILCITFSRKNTEGEFEVSKMDMNSTFEVKLHEGLDGELLYIPVSGKKKKWGTNSGSRHYYEKRNREIVSQYETGMEIVDLAKRYCLSYDSIRKIVRK